MAGFPVQRGKGEVIRPKMRGRVITPEAFTPVNPGLAVAGPSLRQVARSKKTEEKKVSESIFRTAYPGEHFSESASFTYYKYVNGTSSGCHPGTSSIYVQ